MTSVTVTTELTDSQAMALAQFVKRLTWSEMRACAIDDDETWVMKDAIQALQKSLADAGLDQREHPNKNLRFRAIAGSSKPTAATFVIKTHANRNHREYCFENGF